MMIVVLVMMKRDQSYALISPHGRTLYPSVGQRLLHVCPHKLIISNMRQIMYTHSSCVCLYIIVRT